MSASRAALLLKGGRDSATTFVLVMREGFEDSV